MKPLHCRASAESTLLLPLTMIFLSWLPISLIHVNFILGWLYSSRCGTSAGTQPGSGHPLGEWHQREGEAASSAHCGSERWHQVCCPLASERSQRWCTIQGKSWCICREVPSDCQHPPGWWKGPLSADNAALWSGKHIYHFHGYFRWKGTSCWQTVTKIKAKWFSLEDQFSPLRHLVRRSVYTINYRESQKEWLLCNGVGFSYSVLLEKDTQLQRADLLFLEFFIV